MKTKNLFIIILVLAAVLISILALYGVFRKSYSVEEKMKNDLVENVKNLLANPSFETGFDEGKNWEISASPKIFLGFDDIVKKDGMFGLNINSNNSFEANFVFQKIAGIPIDKKISLFGFMKTESADSAKLEIELYGSSDSLLIKGFSESVKGTSDWHEYNAWVKSYSPKMADTFKVVVKCVLYGSGRVWFDNIRLYAMPVSSPAFELKF